VLLISIDTLRADHLGSYGYALPTTPTIDRRLAARGVTFEQVYSQSPKTTPSHMTMLTGLAPCAHGIEMWQGDTRGHVLNSRVHTLAEVLKNAGYATAAFTDGGHLHPSRGFDQGFDLYRTGHPLERALDWIDGHHHRKWFVFFHTYEVHDPYIPPAGLIAQFDPDYRGPILGVVQRLRDAHDGWEHSHDLFWASVDVHDARDVRFVARLYDAGVRAMDESTIAPLLDRLDALGVADDTLVVFTSDHGEAFGEHGRFLHDDLYATTLRVPLILRFPDRLPAGRRADSEVGVIDIMPTVLDLLGVPAPDTVQGRSLLPLLDGRFADTVLPPVVSDYDPAGLASLRRGGLSYLSDRETERLFEGDDTSREQHDLARGRPAELQSARAELGRWRAECDRIAARLGPGGATIAPDEETVRRLVSLGYMK
jgi:arylsulfatase A-like enzyme